MLSGEKKSKARTNSVIDIETRATSSAGAS